MRFGTGCSSPRGGAARRGTARTPGSGGAKTPTFAFGDVDCAVCQSPLDRSRPEASDNPDKVELVTGLACRHVFHRCCLVECRMHGIGRCPTCQAPLPRGFTPETVREERERHRIRDRIIARSRRAADRSFASESLANGTIPPHGASPTTSDGSQTPGTPVMVSLSQDTGMDVYGAAALPPRAPNAAPRTGGRRGVIRTPRRRRRVPHPRRARTEMMIQFSSP